MNQTKIPSRKYALTGKLRTGKDYISEQCKGTILGFADPMYQIGQALFGIGVEGKDDPKKNLRPFYMKLGEWAKGRVDENHPITMERASFTMLMRALGSEICDMPVDWASFGKNENIWLECLLGRSFILSGEAGHHDPDEPFFPECDIFVTNVRYKFELEELRKNDFEHFHNMCSEPTYIERLRQVGIALGDQRLKHVSEMLAGELDRQVYHILRLHPSGPKLQVIWNDVRPCPSDRLFTIDEFKDYVKSNSEQEPQSETSPETSPAPELGESPAGVGDASAETCAGSDCACKPRKGSRSRKNS
jgi:hypothetical protein